MTDRLYYNDPYLQAFDASVQRVDERGARFAVTLDRSAFYPTSGGQPFDTGALGPWRVVEVVDEDDGTITHIVEADPANPESRIPNPQLGHAIHGRINWPRRFDHMQQHTGQHVLSAAFERLFAARTISFHLGSEISTIDLSRELPAADIAAAEDSANAVVWEDRAVAVRYATAEEAAKLPLRKEPARGGTLRLIDIDGFDLSACGGTHVARTGAIGVIAVAAWERFKGGQRISFVCGGRALRAQRSLRDTVASAVRLLSVLPAELAASIERLQGELKEQKHALVALQSDLARYRADEIAASAQVTPVCTLVARIVDGDANLLKSLASAIASRPGFAAVLVSASSPALVVVARSSDVPVSAPAILSSLVERFGGRGGGRAELAQGGGLTALPEEILDAARSAFHKTT
jgi:alanyl-tRNA synthetase